MAVNIFQKHGTEEKQAKLAVKFGAGPRSATVSSCFALTEKKCDVFADLADYVLGVGARAPLCVASYQRWTGLEFPPFRIHKPRLLF